MKKAVVTGGAGFIGSHLAEELVARGYYVTILDDLSTGKLENINGLLKESNAEFVRGSITDLPVLEKLFQDVEYVFHQAAVTMIPSSIEDPLTTNEVNVGGTLKVLLAARDKKVKKVVYASSSAVYGGATPPHKEEMPPNPLSPYAISKLAGEYYCGIFHQMYGLSTVSLRYFNIYGPRQDALSQYATVIPVFISRISQNLPPAIFGDGNQTRDFTFVKDVVRANILAAEKNTVGTFNIGTGLNITINQLVQAILQLTQKDLPPLYHEARPGEVRYSLADITRANTFSYEPKWTLEAGLAETIPFFSQERSKDNNQTGVSS